jgi:hypothetical protein
LLAASLLSFQTVEMAAQERAVLGQGNVSCGSWLENRTDDDVQVAARTAWILGYVTAFNQYGSSKPRDVSQGTTIEEMMDFIDKYCRNHRMDNLYLASAALIDQFELKPGH